MRSFLGNWHRTTTTNTIQSNPPPSRKVLKIRVPRANVTAAMQNIYGHMFILQVDIWAVWHQNNAKRETRAR